MHGLGIEGIERVYGAYDSIVVGKLLKIMPHENSDHLQICTVTTGEETLQIVTGAPNVYELSLIHILYSACNKGGTAGDYARPFLGRAFL